IYKYVLRKSKIINNGIELAPYVAVIVNIPDKVFSNFAVFFAKAAGANLIHQIFGKRGAARNGDSGVFIIGRIIIGLHAVVGHFVIAQVLVYIYVFRFYRLIVALVIILKVIICIFIYISAFFQCRIGFQLLFYLLLQRLDRKSTRLNS